jgi:predicted ATPase
VEDNYIRARELGQQLEESPQLFSALRGLWHYYFVRARLRTARALGEQLYSLAQHLTEPILLMEAHRVLGATLFFLNELVLALSHLEHGLALYDPLQHCDLAFHYGTDPGVACLSFAAWTRWLLGYPDQALCSIQDALTLAHEIGHPLSMAHVLSFAAIVSQLCGDTQGGYERTEALIALSAEQGLPFRMAMGVILRGWALTEQGWEEEGIAQMCQGLAAYHATGAELDRPFFLGLIARAYGKGGQIEVGLHLLDEALTVMRETEQYVYETELYRLRSDLLGLGWPEKEAEAETRLRQAFDIARCQQAKSLELRAATSLARLWQSQGKRQEAYDLLAPVYNWFTEGFDTADLKDAKTLLDKLNADSTLPKT